VLRVHPRCFSRGDVEELGVEAVDAVEEAAPAGVHLAGGGRVGVVVGGRVPAVGGDLAGRVDAVAQEAPEGVRAVGAAGEAAADPDDRDRLGPPPLDPLELGAQLLQLDQGPLEDLLAIDDTGRAIDTPAARYKESLWPQRDPYEEGGDAALRRLARGNFIVAPSVVFRAEAVRAIGAFSPLDFVVDWEYWLRGVLAGFTIAGTHRRLVRFRRHAATATRALERTQDRYREEIALQRWIEREAKLPAQYATVSRIILSEIAATLASGDRARAAELLSFARTEVPGFSGTATSALANLAIASGKLGGRAMLAAQAVALRLAV
jgi:hypothetical protein